MIHDSNLIRDSSMHYPADLPLAVHEGPGHGVADETRRDALEGQLKGRQPGSLSEWHYDILELVYDKSYQLHFDPYTV